METTIFTTDVPLPLAEKIDEWARRLNRSRDWIVTQALGDWVALEEERHRMTLEGLADVDAARLVDHEAVQAWADSLDSDNPLPAPKSRR